MIIYYDELSYITEEQYKYMTDRIKLKKSDDTDFLLRIVEYDRVVDRTLNKHRMLSAWKKYIKRKDEIYFIMFYICDQENVKCPRLKLVRHRSAYYSKKHLIKLEVVWKSICVGTLIHEMAHAMQREYERINKQPKDKRHHGRMFTVIFDYLLHEYEHLWKHL